MVIPRPDFAGAIAHAIARLRAELSPALTYHSLWHTQQDVMPAAVRLARLSHVPEEEIRLLEVAAAYHDIGLIYQHEEHEVIGAQIAAQTLPQFGFGPAHIDRIVSLILATRLPQSPQSPLEEFLADADLDALGREDFHTRSHDLWQEMLTRGQPFTWHEWCRVQLRFLKKHSYFTPAARALRDAGKQQHIAALEQELQEEENISGQPS